MTTASRRAEKRHLCIKAVLLHLNSTRCATMNDLLKSAIGLGLPHYTVMDVVGRMVAGKYIIRTGATRCIRYYAKPGITAARVELSSLYVPCESKADDPVQIMRRHEGGETNGKPADAMAWMVGMMRAA